MARSGVLNVYVEEAGPRARWIFSLMVEQLLGLKLKLGTEPSPGEAVLNYSGRTRPGALNIVPAGLLTEQRIRELSIHTTGFGEYRVLFPVNDGDLPFDPFSMAFYLVSRYEEYLPFRADAHGRFPHTESIAYREDFLNKAIVNRLALVLKEKLLEKFPDLEFNIPEYSFIPTVDIDIAYAHIGKSTVRAYGAMIKLLIKGQFPEISRRIKSMRGKAQDPYDNFTFLLDSFKKYDLQALFFILAGDPGPYDRNLSTKNPAFSALLKELSQKAELGIHPSYGAGYDAARILKEKERVQVASGREISLSRQHFVKMSMPETYEALIKADITDDHSMGYASVSGFRAGIASPYKFYNLKKEEETNLTIHPFAFMDTTLEDYMGLQAGEYLEAVSPIIDEVKAVNATLIGIWHNYAIADNQAKREAFQAILNLAATL